MSGTASVLRVALACLLLSASTVFVVACPATASPPCGDDTDCETGRCRRGACGPACLEDADCATAEVCREGACAARPECAAKTDCATGFSCTDGRCRCDADEFCAANEACLSGQCKPRPACTADADCAPFGRRCEPAQGICVEPCATPADCAPGTDPALATVLYVCTSGRCGLRCVNDTACGAGQTCVSGACVLSTCSTFAQCPAGSYCTGATGSCVPYQVCATTAACPGNFECRAFAPGACPPGFPCATLLCQELPRCLIDGDCAAAGTGPAFCQDHHCQPSARCDGSTPCPADRACVAGSCYPLGCRGTPDCAPGQACVEGQCASAPTAGEVRSVALRPKAAVLAVGGALRFTLTAFRADGSSFPLSSATFTAVDDAGAPSGVASVAADGTVTALTAGRVRIRGGFGSATADEATLTVYAAPGAGRQVVVIDAATRLPLAGVQVVGCDAPSPCAPAAEVTVATGADGVAAFPAFTSALARFSAASAATRADGLPRYDRVSVVSTAAAQVLLPLTENPVHGAAGVQGTISFDGVHGDGAAWIGFAVTATADPTDADPRLALGETFSATLPLTGQRLPVPGAVVASAALGFGAPVVIKNRAYALGPPGLRTAAAFAGKLDPALLTQLTSADLLAYAGAMDFALQPSLRLLQRPYVPDATDLDGDGRCSDAARCPAGTEELPDYLQFPSATFAPRREQARRTELVLPPLPPGLDTAIVTLFEGSDEAGLIPVGLSSRAGGAANPDGSRPLGALVVRSGAPYGGVESGLSGTWTAGVSLAGQGLPGAGRSTSARLTHGAVLPTQVAVPPFLPLAQGSVYAPASRTFQPGAAAWGALATAGATLGKLVIAGTAARHVIWFPLDGAQTEVVVPRGPLGGGTDAAGEAGGSWEISALALDAGVTAEDALDLPGPNLTRLPLLLTGYSRFHP